MTRQHRCMFLSRLCASLVTALVAVVSSAGPVRAQATPAGIWHTISDVTHQPKGIVEIREVDGTFVGKVVRSLEPGHDVSPICNLCPGEKKGKPAWGMEILWGLRADGDAWSGGQILDPDTGKIYKAKMHLEDGGKKLVVRGFIGISLLGRSQTWIRAG